MEKERLHGGGAVGRGESERHSSSDFLDPDLSVRSAMYESKHGPHGAKLTLLPLVAVIFFEVSGGPYGVEDAVKHGGPLLAILGFTIFPLLWSVPEALITAELGTAFPENSGYVVWVSAAFGPFWGFQEGWYKWLSGVVDNSLYPILFLDYLKQQAPEFGGGWTRLIALLVITAGLTYFNYRGLVIVGMTALLLTVFGLLPFVALSLLAIPQIKPNRWLFVDRGRIHWRGYLNNLFWNLNYWDSVSTLAGEVDQPRKTFPRALLLAVVLVVLCYLLPLLAGTGAVSYKATEWEDGFFAVVGSKVGGQWLGMWITLAAALSNMGAFEAEMSSDAFQLLGMAERGMLPEVFTYRSPHGTPVLAILCSASGVLLLSWMSFSEIVEFLNFLYCFGMFLEFGAFVALRFTQPELERPYSVPVGRWGALLIVIPPSVLLLIVMSLASWQTIVVSFWAGVVGALLYPALMYAKHHHWIRFVIDPSLPEVPLLEELEEDADEFLPDDDEGDEDFEDAEVGSGDEGAGGEGMAESLLKPQQQHKDSNSKSGRAGGSNRHSADRTAPEEEPLTMDDVATNGDATNDVIAEDQMKVQPQSQIPPCDTKPHDHTPDQVVAAAIPAPDGTDAAATQHSAAHG